MKAMPYNEAGTGTGTPATPTPRQDTYTLVVEPGLREHQTFPQRLVENRNVKVVESDLAAEPPGTSCCFCGNDLSDHTWILYARDAHVAGCSRAAR